jgi:hypothetical protein
MNEAAKLAASCNDGASPARLTGCPLLAQSGLCDCAHQCPLSGAKRTLPISMDTQFIWSICGGDFSCDEEFFNPFPRSGHHSLTTRRGRIGVNLAKLPGLVCKSFAVQAQHRYWMTQNANLLFIRVR